MLKKAIVVVLVLITVLLVPVLLTPGVLHPDSVNVVLVTASNGGTVNEKPSGSYETGTKIPIQASEKTGYRFDRWTTTEGGSFADAFNATTDFTMPNSTTIVTAQFVPTAVGTQPHRLTVVTGMGGTVPAGYAQVISTDYEQGAKIQIPLRIMQGYRLDRWISSDGGYFESDDFGVTFTMPGNPTTIAATFRRKPFWDRG